MNHKAIALLMVALLLGGGSSLYHWDIEGPVFPGAPGDPLLVFVPPTEANETTITVANTEVNITINETDLDTFKFNWNTTNHTFYNKSLVFAMNFNNNSGIGENYNNSTGTTIVDISKYGNNGTLYVGAAGGGNYTSGKYNGAYNLNGSTDYFEVADDAILDGFTEGATFMFWVKFNPIPSLGERQTFAMKYDTADARAWYIDVINEASASGKYLSFAFTNDTSCYIAHSFNFSFQNSTWYHVAVEWNKDSNATAWVNGQSLTPLLIYSTCGYNTTPSIADSSSPLHIGKSTYNANRNLNGTIDEFRIYNISLSAEDIQRQYLSEFQKYNSNEWLFWTNITSLGVGTYTYYGVANDTTGNSGQTDDGDLRYLTVNIPGVFANNIDSDIDEGNIQNVVTVVANELNMEVVPDEVLYVAGWFYFNITQNAYNQNVTFHITNMDDLPEHWEYPEYFQPVYSYDGITWNRITNTDLTYPIFTFSQNFTQDTVLVAAFYPYTYTNAQDYFDGIDALSFVNRTNAGNSTQNRRMDLLTITNTLIPENEKKVIWITGGQHPMETPSRYVTEGLISFLLNETNVTSQRLRTSYIWKIMPMLNPDGIYAGKSREDTDGSDINREWSDVVKGDEINVTNNTINAWLDAGHTIDLFLDFHSSATGEPYIFTFPLSYTTTAYYDNQTRLLNIFRNYTFYTGPEREATTPGTARVEMYDAHGFQAMTPEVTCYNNTNTIPSLRNEGRNTALTIDEYLRYFLPNITAHYPASAEGNEAGDMQTFNVTVNQTCNCTWYINGLPVQYNTSATIHTYTNTSLNEGNMNFKAVINNTNGSDSQTWLFEVDTDPSVVVVNPGDSIQDAIDSLPPEGGRVELAEGTWNIDTTINITGDNIILLGAGIDKTKIITNQYMMLVAVSKWDDPHAQWYHLWDIHSYWWALKDRIVAGTETEEDKVISNVTIENIYFEGVGTSATDNCGIVLVQGKDLTVSDVLIYKATASGISAAGIVNLSILNSDMDQCGRYGFDSTSLWTGTIKGNIMQSSGYSGFGTENKVRHLNITGNIFRGSGLSGISMYSGAGDNIITDNIMENNLQKGYRSYYSNNKVYRNIIRGNTQEGIYINSPTSSEFTGNTIYDNGGDGIYTENTYEWPSNTITIKNNIITSNAGYGINKNEDKSVFAVSYNDIWDNTLGNYTGFSIGTGNIETDPLLYNPPNDFHLKSEHGRWDGASWVMDGENSPCIDTGDPSSDWFMEFDYPSGHINMGAYGNTTEASLGTEGDSTPTTFEQSVKSGKWQYLVNTNATAQYPWQLNTTLGCNVSYITVWNPIAQGWSVTWMEDWNNTVLTQVSPGAGFAVYFAQEDTITRDNCTSSLNWSFPAAAGYYHTGLDYNGTRNLTQINASIASTNLCNIDYLNETGHLWAYTYGSASNGEIEVRQGQAVWCRTLGAIEKVRSW